MKWSGATVEQLLNIIQYETCDWMYKEGAALELERRLREKELASN